MQTTVLVIDNHGLATAF